MFSVFKNLNRFAGKNKALDLLAIFFARTLPYLVILFLVTAAFVEKTLYLLLVPLASGLISRFLITQGIYFIYKKPRPSIVLESKTLILVPRQPSFPSGHASFFFGISFMLFFYSIPLAAFFIICSCLIGIARVFCGVHWFKDILASAFVGFISSFIVYYLLTII